MGPHENGKFSSLTKKIGKLHLLQLDWEVRNLEPKQLIPTGGEEPASVKSWMEVCTFYLYILSYYTVHVMYISLKKITDMDHFILSTK